MTPQRLLTQGEIEQAIVAICDAMEEATHQYDGLSDDAADLEADYKEKAAKILLSLSGGEGGKTTVAERQAKVDLYCAEQFRAWRLAEVRRQSCREAILSLRARLDAMRTLSASLRHQT